MFKILYRFIPILIFWGVFIFVILQVPYPKSLTQADIFQILAFLIPLFFALTFTFNIFLKSTPSSTTLSLGIIFLLILKALDSFNFVTVALTILASWLLFSYFRKTRRSLTKLQKISKLSGLQRRKRT